MSEHDHHKLDPAQEEARDRVQALSRPAAAADFRARLKQDFVTGSLGTVAGDAPDQPAPQRRVAVRPWLGLGSLAAAAVVLALLVPALNRLPGPTLTGARGTGQVTIDGRTLAVTGEAEIAALLRPGARLQLTGDATLDVDYPGTLRWRFFPGTDITLPAAPGRWYGREVAGHLAYGETTIRTGPRLRGGELTVSTPEGRAVISGTLVSVVRDSSLTCVCLEEGTARMEAGDRDLGLIPPGMRWVVFNDGREPVLLEIAPPHRDHMLEFDAVSPPPPGR